MHTSVKAVSWTEVLKAPLVWPIFTLICFIDPKQAYRLDGKRNDI